MEHDQSLSSNLLKFSSGNEWRTWSKPWGKYAGYTKGKKERINRQHR